MKTIAEKVSLWKPKDREHYRELVKLIQKEYSMSLETAEKRAYDSMMADLHYREMCHDR